MATSLLCDDVRCKARWIHSIYGIADWFACECLETAADDVVDIKVACAVAFGLGLTRRDYRLAESAPVVPPAAAPSEAEQKDSKDTMMNIRLVNCEGMKCCTAYGTNVRIHCERCMGHILESLRLEVWLAADKKS
jgi:hypothetical protein